MYKTDLNSLQQLQEIFKTRGGIDLHIYEDQFHRTDLYFDGKGNRFDVEVKRRRFNSDQYPTAIINQDKYIELARRNAILVYMGDDRFGILKDVRSGYLCTSNVYARSTTDFNGYWGCFPKVELDLNSFNYYDY